MADGENQVGMLAPWQRILTLLNVTVFFLPFLELVGAFAELDSRVPV